jgi:hypothetical protein
MMMQHNDEYLTRDLGESAALLTQGHRLHGIAWKDNFAYFRFGNPAVCEQVKQDYFFRGLQLDAMTFYDNLRLLKRQLYQNEQKGGSYVQSKKPRL